MPFHRDRLLVSLHRLFITYSVRLIRSVIGRGKAVLKRGRQFPSLIIRLAIHAPARAAKARMPGLQFERGLAARSGRRPARAC